MFWDQVLSCLEARCTCNLPLENCMQLAIYWPFISNPPKVWFSCDKRISFVSYLSKIMNSFWLFFISIYFWFIFICLLIYTLTYIYLNSHFSLLFSPLSTKCPRWGIVITFCLSSILSCGLCCELSTFALLTLYRLHFASDLHESWSPPNLGQVWN